MWNPSRCRCWLNTHPGSRSFFCCSQCRSCSAGEFGDGWPSVSWCMSPLPGVLEPADRREIWGVVSPTVSGVWGGSEGRGGAGVSHLPDGGTVLALTHVL